MNHNIYNGSKFGVAFDYVLHSPCANATLKGETKTVQERNGAKKGTVKVLATRIPEKYASPIIGTDASFRAYFDDKRFPRINGQIIIPLEMLEQVWVDIFGHNDISSKHVMGGILGERIVNVAVLRNACETGELQEELNNLGDLASQVKGFTCEEITEKFWVETNFFADMNSPKVQEFLQKLDKELVNKLETRVKADSEASYNKALTEMSDFTASWIERTLGKLINMCKGEDAKGKHFKGLVDDIRELVEQAPKYNLLSDSKVQDTITKIFATFGTLEKAAFKDEKTRKQAVEDAQKILAEFHGEPLPEIVGEVVVECRTDADILDSVPS